MGGVLPKTPAMETPKSDTLEVNLRGRILLGAASHGVRDPRRVAVLARAIVAVVEHCHPEERPSLRQLEPLLTEQLALLEAALVNARAQEAPALAVAAPVAAQTAGPEDEASETAEEPPRGLRRRTLKGKGHTVIWSSNFGQVHGLGRYAGLASTETGGR